MKDYLILFDAEGNRGATYAAGVHYTVDADGAPHDGSINVQDMLKKDYVFVEFADYMNLLGNNKDNQVYIYKDGKFIPKPPYVPTAEETAAAERAELDSEYSSNTSQLANDLQVAMLRGDTDAQKSIIQEFSDMQTAYAEAIKG